MKMRTRLLSLLLSGAILSALTAPGLAYELPYTVDTTVTSKGHMSYGRQTELSKAFAIGSGVLGGDQAGNLNWDSGLTRVEAATMLVRLMGLEEEAKAASNSPSAFTDAPDWARGYLNVAYEKGVSKGVGDGRFDPSGACGVKDFLTMLYRLTELEEGRDYSWSTAVEDFKADLRATPQPQTNNWSSDFVLLNCASQFANYFNAGGELTRASAADAMYLMLLIEAGPDGETLGDILSAKYGMSDMLLFNCGVRRTGAALKGRTSLTYQNLTGSTPTVVSVKDGKLYVEDPHRAEMTISIPTENAWATGESFPCDKPIPLPKQDVDTSVVWNQSSLGGYDEDGDPVYVANNRSEKLYITYADGTWTLSKWSSQYPPDYALVYAYQSDDHWAFTKAVNDAGWNGDPSQEVKDLAAKLTAGKATDLAKAEAISSWVATHIYYDYPAFQGKAQGAHTADEVLSSRKAACTGFAELTRALFRCAGLECCTEENQTHAWNVANLDGKWTVIDNTWDSPLRYEFKTGSGYEYRSSDMDTYFSWLPSTNRQEPEGTWLPLYFNTGLDSFYSSHKLSPDPIVVTGETENISQIKLYR